MLDCSQLLRAHDSRGRIRFGVLFAGAILLGLVSTSCESSPERNSATVGTRARGAKEARHSVPSVATDEPAGAGFATSASKVRDELGALMARYDAATNALLAHLQDAANSSASMTKDYLSVFAPGSAFASGALASWAREGAQGHTYRMGPRGQVVATQVTSVEPVVANTVGFGICVASSFVLVDSAGQVLESQGGRSTGHGVAVLVDGHWLLRDLSLTASSACSARPGSS